MRGYIARISSIMKYVWSFMNVFHVTQSAYRMLTSHAMIFTTWYPFDSSVSPLYEIANFTQVGLHLYWIHKGHSKHIMVLRCRSNEIFFTIYFIINQHFAKEYVCN